MILVLSTMHISKMVLKRKKSYKPKGDEREGVGGGAGEQDRGTYMSRSYIDCVNMM